MYHLNFYDILDIFAIIFFFNRIFVDETENQFFCRTVRAGRNGCTSKYSKEYHSIVSEKARFMGYSKYVSTGGLGTQTVPVGNILILLYRPFNGSPNYVSEVCRPSNRYESRTDYEYNNGRFD